MNKPTVSIDPKEHAEFLNRKDYLLLGVVEMLEISGTHQTMVTIEANSPAEAMKKARQIVDNPEYIHAILELDLSVLEIGREKIPIKSTHYNHSKGDEIIISTEP